MHRHLIRAAVAALVLHAATAQAIGTFVPASPRTDMVYDDRRDIVYIASGQQVLRYRVADATFLAPVTLGGQLRGIDLSPDGSTIAVADASFANGKNWVHLVDLQGGGSRKLEAWLASGEGGTWSVAWTADADVVASSTYLGSGWTPLRRFDPAGGTPTVLVDVRQSTMLSASGDRSTIAFAESNISDGRWGAYYPATGRLVQRQWYENGTSWFNFEISANHDGSQFAIPTYNGAYVYDGEYRRIAILGQYAGPQPVGGAYDPVDTLAYFPWADTTTVKVFDMALGVEVGSYDFQHEFDHTGNGAYGQGRTKVSGDGSLLMVSVDGGIRILRMYAPLRAQSWTERVPRLARHKIPLRGSIGNGGALRYEILEGPAHGVLTLGRGVATYGWRDPAATSDRFVYRVHYGRSWADGVVDITR